MIFFSENIGNFTSTITNPGMQVKPKRCTLTDGRTGYFLGSDWQIEIEAKGATVEQIEKSQINQKSHY